MAYVPTTDFATTFVSGGLLPPKVLVEGFTHMIFVSNKPLPLAFIITAPTQKLGVL